MRELCPPRRKPYEVLFLLLFVFGVPFVSSLAAPVTYSGKVVVASANFNGVAQFTFALIDPEGVVHWRNGADANATINIPVDNGHYSVLLGGQGMNPLPDSLFLEQTELYLRVHFRANPADPLLHLQPDQRITSAMHALSAEVARSVLPEIITTEQLNEQIKKYFKPEILNGPEDPGKLSPGQSITLDSRAEGKFLTYQWYRNGGPIPGATEPSYRIDQVSGPLHEGNYTLVVSNDFGSAGTESVALEIEGTTPTNPTDPVDPTDPTNPVDPTDPTNPTTPTPRTVPSAANLEMIWVEPGTFTMGSPVTEADRQTNETQHEVTLTQGFFLGKYEVTQAQYEAVMSGNSNGLNATPSNWPNNPNRPVEKVSWDDVQVFLTRLNAAEQAAGRLTAGWSYVLPTESEWEYACRAGTTTVYSWGNNITASNANYSSSGIGQTRDVGQYAANPWGFFDMHGNVFEWTADWFGAYPSGSATDPEGPAVGSYRVLRGGSWVDTAIYARSAIRYRFEPAFSGSALGVRLSLRPPASK